MKYLVALIVIVATLRVAATHRVFSPVYDELLHLTAGHEYLTEHRYSVDLEHPPLARAVEALPFLRVRQPQGNWVEKGNALLASGGDYVGGIAKGRRGNLLFLVIGIVAVAGWARERFDWTTAAIAAALFSLLPPVLAHAGLATTDMAGAAALPLALWALDRFLRDPSWRSTFLLGAAIAFGLLTKFSFVPFFFASAVVVYVGRASARPGGLKPALRFLGAILIAVIAVWLAYFGSFGTMTSANPALHDDANLAFGSPWIADHVVMPAPLFAGGLLKLKLDDQIGRDAFLLGHYSHHGWWYYFPIVLGVKTPIPFLILVLLGAIVSKRTLPILAVAAVILGIAMTTHIN
ncbi:MAG TPA: glycosyltransferase family 39 protein, partial [Thermoanaerobaculia bacterium]|nr:glycosyltransferase family 39 protein [Thermoanaerobaculia bacterium]